MKKSKIVCLFEVFLLVFPVKIFAEHNTDLIPTIIQFPVNKLSFPYASTLTPAHDYVPKGIYNLYISVQLKLANGTHRIIAKEPLLWKIETNKTLPSGWIFHDQTYSYVDTQLHEPNKLTIAVDKNNDPNNNQTYNLVNYNELWVDFLEEEKNACGIVAEINAHEISPQTGFPVSLTAVSGDQKYVSQYLDIKKNMWHPRNIFYFFKRQFFQGNSQHWYYESKKKLGILRGILYKNVTDISAVDFLFSRNTQIMGAYIRIKTHGMAVFSKKIALDDIPHSIKTVNNGVRVRIYLRGSPVINVLKKEREKIFLTEVVFSVQRHNNHDLTYRHKLRGLFFLKSDVSLSPIFTNLDYKVKLLSRNKKRWIINLNNLLKQNTNIFFDRARISWFSKNKKICSFEPRDINLISYESRDEPVVIADMDSFDHFLGGPFIENSSNNSIEWITNDASVQFDSYSVGELKKIKYASSSKLPIDLHFLGLDKSFTLTDSLSCSLTDEFLQRKGSLNNIDIPNYLIMGKKLFFVDTGLNRLITDDPAKISAIKEFLYKSGTSKIDKLSQSQLNTVKKNTGDEGPTNFTVKGEGIKNFSIVWEHSLYIKKNMYLFLNLPFGKQYIQALTVKLYFKNVPSPLILEIEPNTAVPLSHLKSTNRHLIKMELNFKVSGFPFVIKLKEINVFHADLVSLSKYIEMPLPNKDWVLMKVRDIKNLSLNVFLDNRSNMLSGFIKGKGSAEFLYKTDVQQQASLLDRMKISYHFNQRSKNKHCAVFTAHSRTHTAAPIQICMTKRRGSIVIPLYKIRESFDPDDTIQYIDWKIDVVSNKKKGVAFQLKTAIKSDSQVSLKNILYQRLEDYITHDMRSRNRNSSSQPYKLIGFDGSYLWLDAGLIDLYNPFNYFYKTELSSHYEINRFLLKSKKMLDEFSVDVNNS